MTLADLKILQLNIDSLPAKRTNDYKMWVSDYWYNEAEKAANNNENQFSIKDGKLYFCNIELIKNSQYL